MNKNLYFHATTRSSKIQLKKKAHIVSKNQHITSNTVLPPFPRQLDIANKAHQARRITPIKSNTEPVHFILNKQLKVMRWLSKTLSFF